MWNNGSIHRSWDIVRINEKIKSSVAWIYKSTYTFAAENDIYIYRNSMAMQICKDFILCQDKYYEGLNIFLLHNGVVL